MNDNILNSIPICEAREALFTYTPQRIYHVCFTESEMMYMQQAFKLMQQRILELEYQAKETSKGLSVHCLLWGTQEGQECVRRDGQRTKILKIDYEHKASDHYFPYKIAMLEGDGFSPTQQYRYYAGHGRYHDIYRESPMDIVAVEPKPDDAPLQKRLIP